jgi:hypothetical protein
MVEIIFCPVDETDTFIDGVEIYFYLKSYRALYSSSASELRRGVSSGSSNRTYAGARSSSRLHSADSSRIKHSSSSDSEPRRRSSNE